MQWKTRWVLIGLGAPVVALSWVDLADVLAVTDRTRYFVASILFLGVTSEDCRHGSLRNQVA